jgi:hypothetical protein
MPVTLTELLGLGRAGRAGGGVLTADEGLGGVAIAWQLRGGGVPDVR